MAIVAVALLVVVLIRTSRLPAAASVRNASQPAALPVSVATVSRIDLPVRLSALGSVVAFNTVTVRPRVDGQLMRILFREGQNDGLHRIAMDPHAWRWYRVGAADDALERSDLDLTNPRR